MPAPAYDTLERARCKDRSRREDHTGETHIEDWHQKIDALKLPDGNQGDGGQNGTTQGNKAGSDLYQNKISLKLFIKQDWKITQRKYAR